MREEGRERQAATRVSARVLASSILANALVSWMGALVPTVGWTALIFVPFAVLWAAVHPVVSAELVWVHHGVLYAGEIAAAAVVAGLLAPEVVLRLSGWPSGCARVGRPDRRLVGIGLLTGVLTGIGYVLVVPGVMFHVDLLTVGPAATVENRRVWSSVRRSRALAGGRRWPLRWLALVMLALQGGCVALIWLLMLGPGAGPDVLREAAPLIAGASLVLCSLHAHVMIVAFHELRVAEKGALGELREVFD